MKKYHGFGDVISDIQNATDPDTVEGLKALTYFWQAAQPLNSQMPTDFPTFLKGLQTALVPTSAENAWPGYVGVYYPNAPDAVFKLKVSGIGNMANVGGNSSEGFFSTLLHLNSDVSPMTDDQVQAAMQQLATQGGGKIPADFNAFVAAFQGEAESVSFLDALWYTIGATAAQAVQGAEAVGNAALSTAQGILAYKNYLLIGAGVLGAALLYLRFVPRRKSS